MACQALAATLLAATFGWGSASAEVVISNLDGNDQSASTLVGNLKRSKAIGFTMAGADAYLLGSVVLRLAVSDTTETIGAALFGESAGAPTGTALVNFTIPAFSVGTQNYTLLPDADFVLQPLTTYFLVAYGTSQGSSTSYIDWLAGFPAVVPTGLATYAGAFADNTGAAAVPPSQASSTINSFAVNATAVNTNAVPEPGSLSLLVLAAFAAGAAQFRRRAQAHAVA